MKRPRISSISILIMLFCWTSSHAQRSIEGVWQVSRIDREYSLDSIASPLPSQIIFTKSHYSIVWMPGSKAMRAFDKRWEPTEEEKLRRYEEIVVNTGSYTIDGDQLKIEPVVSRVPEFMGGFIIYEYRWSADKLVLTFIDEETFDGVTAPWVETRGGREHLTLVRVTD